MNIENKVINYSLKSFERKYEQRNWVVRDSLDFVPNLII